MEREGSDDLTFDERDQADEKRHYGTYDGLVDR